MGYGVCFQCLEGTLLKTEDTGNQQPDGEHGEARESRLGQPRSVRVGGRRTSLKLEPTVWLCLSDIVEIEGVSLDELITRIDRSRRAGRGLASEVRVFVAKYWRERPGGK
ncbi:MAG: ribbon-helix-helix domain-containing protein [Pseudomonadota bacterium]